VVVTADEAGMRVDRFLEAKFPGLSFSHIQRVIRKGELRVNGKRVDGKDRLEEGQSVRIPPLKVDAPKLGPMVVPITVAVLVCLFAVQRRGTGFIGGVFGPIMLAWFAVIAILGIRGIVMSPGILVSFNPLHAIEFLIHAPSLVAFAVLGATFLAVTGGEAMYADMGHFGRRPIRLAWLLILPALTLNYLGQGAYVITHLDSVNRAYGAARAVALSLLAEPVSAEQAANWGLIWKCIDDDKLMSEANQLAQRLASGPTRAYSLIKQALNASPANTLEQQLALEAKLQREAGRTADFTEGVKAFLEKRGPRYVGR
jgi:hypothetical protein